MSFDYEKLLRAYLDHVDTCEGFDFLERYPTAPPVDGLTLEETKELMRIADEINEQRRLLYLK